jgi:hypothetical protein
MAKKKGGGSRGATWLRRGYKPRRGPESSAKYTPRKVFVAMVFERSPKTSKTYQAIVRACESNGLSAFRIDQTVDSGPINIQVIDGIEDSEFLIFDLTKERPNVYYELGYAHGIGNRPEDIVLIAREGAAIHFDIMSLRILFYDSPKDLEEKLFTRLENLIAFHRAKTGA